jgi:hypothetical protein
VLEVPRWLAKLAETDDPPTVIGDELLKRFERAGVDRFAPFLGGDVGASEEEAEQAVGIAAYAPGVGIAESFEGEPDQVGAALRRLVSHLEHFDQVRRFRLAAVDMRLVERTAKAMLASAESRAFERVLETGLIVTYARPYLDSNKAGGVGGRWQPPPGPDRDFHRWVIDEMRHTYHAHADRTPRRTIMDTTELLGEDGPPTYSEAWWRLTRSELATLGELARKQAERFEAAATKATAPLRQAE